MRIFLSKQLTIFLVTTIALAQIACEETHDAEAENQESIYTLIQDLRVATSSNDEDSLDALIASANRLQPSSSSQTQSKNLIISTAKEKLAQLKFHRLSAETIVAQNVFKIAEVQAVQTALLRTSADVLTSIPQQNGISTSKQITSDQNARQGLFDAQLTDSNAKIKDLDSKSQASRDKAEALRQQAEQLLELAEEKGIIDGHASYKSGIRTLRQSQQNHLSAAELELQSQMNVIPMRDNAKVELEAIASILDGMRHTDSLLQELRETSKQNAANFSKLANEIDLLANKTLDEAVIVANSLLIRWNELAELLQDAMNGTGRIRGGSRETQATAAMWKLDLEWTLGRVEETKRTFLVKELRTIETFIACGITSSSSAWGDLTSSISNKIEQATINALSSYENATQAASNVGSQSNTILKQLETRMAILKGEATPEPVVSDLSNNTNIPASNPTSSGGGFTTPQELVSAFNTAIDITSFDGNSPIPNLSTFCKAEDSTAEKFISFMNNTLQATGNVLIAIREHMGEEAVTQFLATNPANTQSSQMKIDPNSVVQIDENNASASEVSGKSVKIKMTPQGWKLAFSSSSDPQEAIAFTMMSEMMTPLLEAMKVVTEQINNGQISSIEQLNAAMMSAIENMNPF